MKLSVHRWAWRTIGVKVQRGCASICVYIGRLDIQWKVRILCSIPGCSLPAIMTCNRDVELACNPPYPYDELCSQHSQLGRCPTSSDNPRFSRTHVPLPYTHQYEEPE